MRFLLSSDRNNSTIVGLIFYFFVFTVSGQEKLKVKGLIPTLAAISIPAAETTVERYNELKQAGFTHTGTHFSTADEQQKALDIAAQVGVKMIVLCPGLITDTEKTVKRFMNHPATAGYFLGDEPHVSKMAELGELVKNIQKIDTRNFCDVNIYGNIASPQQLGTSTYKEYVEEYIKQIPVNFLSFDIYPVLKEGVMPSWYENLELIAHQAKKVNKPFWAFVLSSNYTDIHPDPQTLAAMRLQAYCNLAYGAQGIQYFTYWSATSTDSSSVEDLRAAPITVNGKRTIVYDRVKQLNQEIHALSGVFFGSKLISVRHTGGRIPSGTVRLTSLPNPIKVLDSGDEPILVSLLENEGNRFLVIVNKNHLKSIRLTIFTDDTVQKVLKDGTLVAASAYDNALELDAGDVAIYMFPTKY